jgi:hypothetical protein
VTVFWDVAPCTRVEIDRHFGGAYRLYNQGGEPLCTVRVHSRKFPYLPCRHMNTNIVHDGMAICFALKTLIGNRAKMGVVMWTEAV